VINGQYDQGLAGHVRTTPNGASASRRLSGAHPLKSHDPEYTAGVMLDLFAGVPVSDYARSLGWYERLLGSPPTFLATPTEAVWELAEHRYLYIEERTGGAGHALITVFVDDFDGRLASSAARGLEPEQLETYDNGIRKATFCDPDGNQIGFGGAPLES
jgi:catechol 2,3-dioxygenase-like lactoylglutathione lyase family enzyme